MEISCKISLVEFGSIKALVSVTYSDLEIKGFTAHIICASSGYATPECAAQILLDAAQGKENGSSGLLAATDASP